VGVLKCDYTPRSRATFAGKPFDYLDQGFPNFFTPAPQKNSSWPRTT